MAFTAQPVIANPLNPQVMSGQASFANVGNVMTVTNTPGTIINWSSFSIGKSETTRFAQQSAASSVLNRVTGVDPSTILGSLQSNGRVFLINPNGIVFGAGSTVDVAGMVASTLNLSNADFLAGRNHFTAIPNAANLSNAGNITTTNAGHVYLIAPNVENTGVITSPNGEILLAAGSNVDLVNSASPNLRVNITAGAGNATNMGQLVASSGTLGLFGALVKNTGVVNADGVVVQGGEVIFKASSRAEVGGTVSANGTTGGTVQVLGNEVGIMGGAHITANGTQGGGTILVGGDTRGLNPAVQNAQVTYVDPNATISADATQNGNGGKVVVWSDDTTRMYGAISARGGALSGNGGFVETSGKKMLDVSRAPDVSAVNGQAGSWLLDPETINIVATASVNATAASPFSPAAAGTSSLSNAVVNAALNAGGTVIIDTTGGGAGVGDINVNAVLSKTAGAASTLNFNAHGNVNVNSAITSTVGALNINFTPGQAGAVATTNVLANIAPNGGVVTFNKASSLVSAAGITLGGVGGGTFVNPLGASMTLSGTTLNNVTFNNNNTVNQTGNVLLTNGAIFNNNPGANYNLNTTAAQYLYANNTGTFNNLGTLTQQAATATNIYSGVYVGGVNAGTLTFNEASTGVLAGTGARLNMAANLTSTGNLTLQGLGLGLAGNATSTYNTLAPTTMTGALTMLGAGNAVSMNLAGGSLTVAAGAGNTLTVAGGTITTGANRLIINGTADLSGALPVDATLGAIDVSGTGTLNLNATTIDVGAGGLNLATGSTFNPLNSSIVGVGAGQVGTVNASAGSLVTLNGTTLNNLTFNNATTVNQTGTVLLTNGAIFNNNLGANYNLNTTAAQYLYANNTGTFNNLGTLTQQAATATNIYSGVYVGGVNAGTLTFNEASTGVLAGTGARLNMAANLTSTGNLTLQGLGLGLAGNATSTYNTLAPTTMTGALTMLGAGNAASMNLAGGSLTVAAGAGNTLTVAGGTITTGANRLIINGTADLSGALPVDATLGAIDVSGTGTLNLNATTIDVGAGGLNLAAGSTFNPLNSSIVGVGAGQVGTVNASAGSLVTLNGTTLNNLTFNNATTVNQTGTVLLTNGAIFNNNLGANYNLNTTAAQYLYANNTGTFNNLGTLTQQAATATNIYSGVYVGGVNAGTLTFNEASTGVLAGIGARLNMAANLTSTGNLTLQGLGLGLAGNATSTYNTLAPTTMTGALTMLGAGNAPVMNLAGGSLTVAAGAGNTLTVAGGTVTGLLNNQATLNVTGGTLGDVNNTGTLNAPAVLTLTGSYTQSGAGVLTAPAAGFTMNAGTDITLNNTLAKPALSGLWTLSAGRSIALNGSITTNNTAFTAVANSGGLNNNGTATPATLTLGAGATINAGTGTVNLAVTGGNFFNNSGSTTPIIAGNTRIYSTDPRLNDVGGMVTQSRLYLCRYTTGCGAGVVIPSTNTVYLYSIADPTPVLTVTANALSKVYGTVDPTLTYTVTGLIGGDSAAGVLSGGLSRVAGNNVGNYAINNAGLVTNGYVLSYVSNNLTITPASLVVSGLTAANKVYNGNVIASVNAAAATYSGLVAGDTVTMSNTAAFADKNAGAGKVVAFTSAATGASAANYTIVNQAATTANITPAALNIAATGINKVYDATTAATVTLADNRIAGDVLTTAYTTAAFLDKNVAVGKTVNVSGLSLAGADATNYTFNTTAATTADITARPLTMTGLTVANKVYDGTVAATVTGGTYNNIIAGDAVTVGGLTASFADANAAVGKTVTVTGAASFTGADAGNYTITAAAPSTALANITPRPLTVVLASTNRVYDGTTVANASGSGASLLNVVAGENVGFSAGPLVPYLFNTGFGFTTLNALATPTTSFADKNVGNGKVITLDQPLNTLVAAYSSPGPIANSINWGGTGNYSFASITNATGNITPLAVQLSGTRVYDATLAANSAILNVANKVVGDVLTLSGGATLASKAVGNQAVAANGTLGLAGVDAPNYTLTGSAGTVAITPANLTVSGNVAVNKVYDGGIVATVNSTGAVYAGIFAGDVVTVSTAGAFADKNVAVGKTVSLSSAGSGADAGNYTIVNQAATTADITAKALTVAATGINKVYDATTAATVTLADNRVIGDVLTTVYTTANFADKNVGVGKTVNVAGITLAGADSTNYSFNTTAATTADITAKALTVSGITAANKVYDGTTAATINTAGAIYTGLIAGDVATASAVGATGSFVDKNVGINKGVSITGMTLTGADALNYSFNATAATTANITGKALTVAGITAANKVYDATTAATVNVAGATYTGLVAGDVLAVNATGTFADKNVAAGKVVTLTSGYTGADVGNYLITNQGTTNANITGKALTIAGITAANKVYDATTAATVNVAGATYTGLVAGDVLAVNATGTFADKNAALGKTVTLTSGYTGADAGNYLITNQGTTTADITAKALTVSGITAANKVYDGTTAATINTAGAIYTGLIAGDVATASAVGATGSFVDKNVGINKGVSITGMTLTGADALNYSFNATAATTANITGKALTIAGITAANKVYDATTAATVNVAGATYTGLVAGDVLAVNATGTFADKNAALGKTVTLTSGYTGADAGNYLITNQGTTNADITAKALTVGATGINKIYDATTAATVALTDNRVAGDVLTTGYTTANFADKNVGVGKAVNVTGVTLAGTDALNYSFNTTAATTANITAKALTVGATGINKIYDATTAATVALTDNRVAGDVLTTGYTTANFADKNVGVGKAVNVTGVTLAGTDALNYSFNTTAATTANITAKALTVGATGINKVYDATTAATVALTDNRVAGDVLTTGYTTANFADKNVGVGKAVNVTGVTLAGTDALNYSFNTTAAATANITGRILTVLGITAASKVYDGTTAATVNTAGATYTGLLAGDVVTVSTAGVTGNFADKNVGVNKGVSIAGMTLAGLDAGNYLTTGLAATTANITAKALTVAGITAANKVYDGTTAANINTAGATYTGLVAGDLLAVNATGNFADKNAAVGKVVTLTSGYTGADVGNYTITNQGTTTANITPATLNIAATGTNKVYDATTAATVTLADNRIAGDALTTGYTTANFADKNVGVGKAVNVAGITLAGVDSTNYNFNTTAATTANITAKALTVAGITAANKVYDGTTAATVNVAGATYTGLVAGDVLAVNATGTFADKNVAAGKVVTLTSGYTGADVGNYLITDQGTTTADITAKALTVGATGINKVYDATTAATVTLADNRIAGDVLTTGYTTANFADKNVGVGKAVNVTGVTLAGTDALNYSFNTTAATTANITVKALTVGATGINKVYDATTAATVTLADNRVIGDVLTTGYTTAAFLDKNVGVGKAVNVAGISLAGADALNYSFNATAVTNANITAKALTVAGITAANKVYDGTTAATVNVAGATYTGLVAGDVLAVNATGNFTNKNAAVGKTVTLTSGYTGADAGNYLITGQGTTNANITAKALTVGATGINKVYDATTAATVTLADNRVIGDVLTTGYTTAAFLDKNVGVGKAVNVAGISLAGADALNYSFNATAVTNANITAKALTVAGITAANKVYDGTTAATVNVAGATYTGLVAGDVLAVNATGTFADKNVAAGKVVTLTSGYTGADVGNYLITNQGTTNANITPAALAVAANIAGKVYGSVDPGFGYTATGLVAGDTAAIVLTGTLARIAGENVGAYAINQGTLVANTNYTLGYTANNLTITPAALSVVANAQTKASGAVDPALTYVTTGFKFADTAATALTGGLSRIAGEAAGAYAINQGLLASNANYTIAYIGNNLTINTAPVGAAVAPVDIVNTILIPGNTAPGTAHSTIQTANTLNNKSAFTDTVAQMDNVNTTASSVALVCREGGVSGEGVLAAINSMPPTAAGGSGYSYQGLQAVPLCVMSVH